MNDKTIERAIARGRDAEAKLAIIQQAIDQYFRGEHPELALLVIAQIFARECSICRRRHGSEVQHAAE